MKPSFDNAPPVSPISLPLEQALCALGKVLSTASVYGMEHPRSTQEVEAAHAALAPVLPDRKRLRLDLVDGRLLANGQPVDKPNPMIRVLKTRLTNLKISGFSIDHGLDAEGLGQLLSLLATAKAGEFERDLASSGIAGVKAEKLEYQAVSPGQKTDGKGEIKSGVSSAGTQGPSSGSGGPGRGRGAGGGGAGGPHVLDLGGEEETTWLQPSEPEETPPPESSPKSSGEIIAFLRGESGGAGAPEEIARMLSEPERLAGLIWEAAAVRQADPNAMRGESMGDLILGCLRRTYEGLKTTVPTLDDSDAPVTLRNSLLLLEKNILDRFRTIMQPADPNTEATIRAAVRKIDQTLELDLAAAQYVEHRAAVVRSERRIAEYLKVRGPEEVESHLREAGLSLSEWKRLRVRSAARENGSGGRGGDGMPAGLGTLAMILERFDSLMRQDQRNPGQVRDTIAAVEEGLDVSAEKAGQRIEGLASGVARIRDKSGEVAESGTKLLEQLAEISQELLQPLTVINCSLQMLLDGFLGEVVEEQRDVLQLSSASGIRMKELMDRLIVAVGYPHDPKIPGTQPPG